MDFWTFLLILIAMCLVWDIIGTWLEGKYGLNKKNKKGKDKTSKKDE